MSPSIDRPGCIPYATVNKNMPHRMEIIGFSHEANWGYSALIRQEAIKKEQQRDRSVCSGNGGPLLRFLATFIDVQSSNAVVFGIFPRKTGLPLLALVALLFDGQ
jgi:hypothetical protein